MSKSILMIDTPENCTECPLELEVGVTPGGLVLNANICRGCGRRNMESSKKPDWCPLREVPAKLEIHCTDTMHHRYAKDGYNFLINQLLEGGQEN